MKALPDEEGIETCPKEASEHNARSMKALPDEEGIETDPSSRTPPINVYEGTP